MIIEEVDELVEVQILSKVLSTKDYSLIEGNFLTDEYFPTYKEEFNYIRDHYAKYKTVPDELTFLEKFEDFQIVEVNESDSYLIDKIREVHLFNQSVPILQKAAQLYKQDSNKATEYIISQFKQVQPNYGLGGLDIIQSSMSRYEDYKDRKNNQEKYYFSTGLKELDEITHGIQRSEEFFLIFARVNNGKSFLLEKFCISVWEQGHNVGYISPEMSPSSIGYRFDTLYKNFSNSSLVWGKDSSKDAEYKDYLEKLKENKNKFIVATPADFNRRITVSKLRNWIKQYDLDMIAIDGLTYMSDERYRKGDNKTTSLTNISEDLMSLSVEMGVPVLAVIQANRGGVVEDEGTPELESIRDSDGVSHNASKVISIKNKYGVLEIGIKKQRNGRVGDTLKFNWDVDKGIFSWIPTEEDNLPKELIEDAIQEQRAQYEDLEDVF